MTEIVVYTAGTWDLFHKGHLNLIRKSKMYGGKLIVGVSTDELVFSYKRIKPFISFEERFEIIQSLKYVDLAVRQTKLIDIEHLKLFNVDVVTIADSWKGKYIEGIDWMSKQENKFVVYLQYTKGISSSIIRERIVKEYLKNKKKDGRGDNFG